jgi:hypothetical protein
MHLGGALSTRPKRPTNIDLVMPGQPRTHYIYPYAGDDGHMELIKLPRALYARLSHDRLLVYKGQPFLL